MVPYGLESGHVDFLQSGVSTSLNSSFSSIHLFPNYAELYVPPGNEFACSCVRWEACAVYVIYFLPDCRDALF